MTNKIKNNYIIYLIPFFLGIFSSFSLPPYNIIFINFITLSLLFYIYINNYQKGKCQSFFIGWFFGFGFFLSSLYWITNSLTFDDSLKNFIPFAFFLIPAFLGIFYGLITLISFFFNLRKNYTSILIFSIIFAIIEFLRGFIFGGFPWNLFVYSLIEYNYFIQILSLIGTHSLNLFVITIFLVPTIFLFKQSIYSKLFVAVLTTSFVILIYFYGLISINKFEKINKSDLNTKLKIISPKIAIERYYENNDPQKILNELAKLSKINKNEKTIFIYPEGILTGLDISELKLFQKFFKDNYSENHHIIMGLNSVDDDYIFNSMIILDNNLKLISKYDKNKLVPFGEFLPFESLLSKLGLKKITQGYNSFSSGKERKILEINDLSFLPLICYEIIYSGKLNLKKKDYDFIVNISEDGWFKNSIGLDQHFAHSIFRAVEEGKNLIRAANNGTSAHITPTGNVNDKIKSTDKGVIEIKNFKKTKKTLFSIHGNKLFFYFILIYISLIFFLKFIRR